MSDPFLGEIVMFAGTFEPRGWAFCNGRLLSIAESPALFSILGTTYGGNGTTTFALPDLRGRVAISSGQGPGLSNHQLGEMSGTETVTLTTAQIPTHNHFLAASSAAGDQTTPLGNLPAGVPDHSSGNLLNAYSAAADGAMARTALTPAGNGQPHTNLQPFLCVNFIIAMEGVLPSRS
jgi:microcystin-dependent protein